jgi:hypothetical protein
MPLTGETIRANIERYLNDTMESRAQSELCRDYYDGKQWTDEEVATLKARHQAPIVVNRIKPKVQGLVGLWDLRSSDPKAYPRTRKHEDAGHVVTDGLRFVKRSSLSRGMRVRLLISRPRAASSGYASNGYRGIESTLTRNRGS